MNSQSIKRIAGLCILLFCSLIINLNGCREKAIQDDRIDALTAQRDSIVGYNLEQSIMNEIKYKDYTDSVLNHNRIIIQGDSINQRKVNHDKNKVRHYTPTERDRIRDSIANYNGL